MANIFDEENMRRVLAGCTPEGETLLAGIHGVTLQLNKKKTSVFDVYIGLTVHCLLVAECEERNYFGELYRVPDKRKAVAQEVGVCFLLADIQDCALQNGLMGAVNCSVTLKDGGFLKLQMPKRGGLGGGMPHHAEYRQAIIDCLKGLPCAH